MINYIYKIIKLTFLKGEYEMYSVKESTIKSETGKFTSYGIEYDGKEINDISLDKEKVENFVDVLNRLGVSEIHIEEVVEDFLAE